MFLQSIVLLAVIYFFTPVSLFAFSYAESRSETNVEGEGSVYSRLEVEVNGEKKVLESTTPGKHELILQSDTEVTETSSPEVKGEEESGEESAETEEVGGDLSSSPSHPFNILNKILALLRKILDRLFIST